MQLNAVHLNQKANANTHPWPHWIFDNLLADKDFKAMQRRILKKKPRYLSREDDPEKLQFTSLPDMQLFKFLISNSFKGFLENTVGERLRLYSPGAIQLRKMTEDSPAFPPHYDFIDQRSLVMLYYVSKDWEKSKGGELQLLKNKRSSIHAEDCVSVAPLENRMVLFFSDKSNWHAVSQVHDWTRLLVMAEWTIV